MQPQDSASTADAASRFIFDGAGMATLRRQMGISRETMSVLIGRGYHSIVSYELGRAQPPLATAAAIAEALRILVDDLIVRQDRP